MTAASHSGPWSRPAKARPLWLSLAITALCFAVWAGVIWALCAFLVAVAG